LLALTLIGGLAAARSESLPDDRAAAHGISIYYTAEQEGFVTLVVEDAQGNRVKNLVLDYPVHTKEGMSSSGIGVPGEFCTSEKHKKRA
jgi:hypothetical protein